MRRPAICRSPSAVGGGIVDVIIDSNGDEEDVRSGFTHSVPLELAGSTAGALYVGPGWDGALLGMALYLTGRVGDDPVAVCCCRRSPRHGVRMSSRSRGAADAVEA